MDFQLKTFKYIKANSRDSHCFSATLYLDGKALAYCSDDGWGGETVYRPAKGRSQADRCC